MQRAFTSLCFTTLPLAILGCLIPSTAQAQIAADGTTSTMVNKEGNDFTIEQGDRRGDNLFHSFDEFSVPTGGSAAFNNVNSIANIFSRVTGSNISDIDGLLSANGAANLFLINPNGIMFGENASLNLGGSFFASTADSLLFEGNAEFSAVNPQAAPLLEVSIPIGARFRDNPGNIVNLSRVQDSAGNFVGLEILPGKNLTLVGGNIDFEGGKIFVPGGRVELGGLLTAGEIGINNDGSLDFYGDISRSDVSLSNGSSVDLSAGGGFITFNAGNLELTESIISNNTDGQGNAGDVIINAENEVNFDNSRIESKTSGEGNAGTIRINADSFSMNTTPPSFSRFIVDTTGIGDGGNINIRATDIFINGAINSLANFSEGNAGNIEISTSNLTLGRLGAIQVSTLGTANAGRIKIDAKESILLDGGSSTISSATVKVVFPEFLNIKTPELTGNGGDIEINTDSLVLNNSLLGIQSRNEGSGNGGDIKISSNYLSINKSKINVASTENGNAGNTEITSGRIQLNSGEITAETFFGTGGDITLNIDENLTLRNNSKITSRALENANGGNVTINASDGFILAFPNQNNDIFANAAQGNGGNINIFTQAIFGLEERRSTPPNQTNDIDASSEFGLQGNLSLNTPDFDPTTGLIDLPASVGDASDQISQNPCEQGVGSEFIITGKGGIPPTVNESLNSEEARVDLIEPLPYEEKGEKRGDEATDRQGENTNPEEAVPAMGWVFNDKGEVTLTAYPTSNQGIQRSLQPHHNGCSSQVAH